MKPDQYGKLNLMPGREGQTQITPPTETFNPTPEQVEEVQKRIVEYWSHMYELPLGTFQDFAYWHLTELHRETETLRSQVEELNLALINKKGALGKYGNHQQSCPDYLGLDCTCGYHQALAQLSPK